MEINQMIPISTEPKLPENWWFEGGDIKESQKKIDEGYLTN
jgi:hypothetical protein